MKTEVPKFTNKRMQREAKTVKLMIHRYCRDKHHTRSTLCRECEELLSYAFRRLSGCPFQENKTTCGKCPVHCYKPDMRQRIQEVMRYVGPRMMLTNPVMAIRHCIDGLRKEPGMKKNGR
ncbi:MAG: nitrous oxide-stimulated promoter family protein [Desulfobulbaceae bacterium]|nr:nitrous oxide-stimulated promoter family protein [Desulfobulbaceae bacterium]